MGFYLNVLSNLGVIGIAMTLRNKFLFKLDLFFMRCMHTNTKNKMWTPKRKTIFDFPI